MTAEEAASGWDARYDWVVVGGGVGGLTAALVGALEGQRTLIIERASRLGGTSARSSGTVWIPDNPYMRRAGITDDRAKAHTYLSTLMAGKGDPALLDALLEAGPAMVAYLEQRADIRYQPYAVAVDYRQDVPGAAQGMRPLEPLPFDGRTLGKHFDRVAFPIPELTLFNGMMVTRGEIARLLKIGKTWDSLWLGARLTLRYLWDRLRYQRGTRLVLGNALVARLYHRLLEHQVPVWFETEVAELLQEGSRVVGLVLKAGGSTQRVEARRGIVLAGGGFPASPEMRRAHLPQPTARFTAAADSCTGGTIDLALRIGAVLGTPGEDNALWFPSSVATRPDGSLAVYPHIVLDRPKPGVIAVNVAGKRFVNEGASYHEFVRGMYRSHRTVPTVPAYLVCDRRFLWKYGLGMVRPLTVNPARYVRSGYLTCAATVAGLAQAIGVDATGLEASVRRHNEFARTGVDLEFGKGGNAYDRSNGDAEHMPNPCLGPIEKPPFYAVAVWPTPLGTSLGLRTDAHGQVLNDAGHAIAGLYACGNDMHTPIGGEYPGPGAQLGPAMTFGYLAALHGAGVEADQPMPLPVIPRA